MKSPAPTSSAAPAAARDRANGATRDRRDRGGGGRRDEGTFSATRDYRNLFGARPDNTFLMKVAYWFGR